MIENEKEFKKWFVAFHKKEGGYEVKEDWFEKTQQTHKRLRKFLTSPEITLTIKIEENQKEAAEKYKKTIKAISWIIPGLNKEIDLDKLLLPKVKIGKKEIGTAKAIFGWLEKLSPETNIYDRSRLNGLISVLGEGWKNAKTHNDELEVVLTTKAANFAMLGHYGPDNDSCFAQCGGSNEDKYVLGQTEDTFVLLVKKNGKVIARFWGFASKDQSIFTITNFYMLFNNNEGDVLEAVNIFFSNLLKIDNKDIYEHDSMAEIENIYYNQDSISFSKEKNIGTQLLIGNAKGVSNDKECPGCYDYCRHEDWQMIDGRELCPCCVDNAGYCELTNKLTFSPLVDMYNSYNQLLLVSEIEAKKQKIPKCDECGVFCRKSAMKKGLCFDCIKAVENA